MKECSERSLFHLIHHGDGGGGFRRVKAAWYQVQVFDDEVKHRLDVLKAAFIPVRVHSQPGLQVLELVRRNELKERGTDFEKFEVPRHLVFLFGAAKL